MSKDWTKTPENLRLVTLYTDIICNTDPAVSVNHWNNTPSMDTALIIVDDVLNEIIN